MMVEKLKGSLWPAADNLRANSKLTSSEYCMPVLGVINHFGPSEVLMRAFEEMTVPSDKQLQLLHLQNQNLRVARDQLLPGLMNGEIAA